MAFDVIIRNGTIVREDRVSKADLAIADEKIVELSPEIGGDAKEVIDATGLHIFPGVIDPHVHFNEPGRTEWEGIATGSSALAAGGGTCFFDMPLNSSPPVLDGESFDLKLAAAKAKSVTDFALWGGLTPDNLDKLEELAERGVVGFKAFMCDSGIADFRMADDYTLYRGMQIAAKLGLVVAVHAENDAITSGLASEAIRNGRVGLLDYARSRPVVAEVEAIQRAIAMAEATDCKLRIVHVSSEKGSWKAHVGESTNGITYETCPHYFLLTEDDLPILGARAKCAPPLRAPSDADHFRFVLSTEEISFVASDHSPSLPSMKLGNDFFKIWGGITGVQSTLAALLTIDPPLPLDSVTRLTAANIATRFSLRDKGRLSIGSDGDLTLVDISARYDLTESMLLDRHKLSPYMGRSFRGRVRRTLVRGQTVFLDDMIVSEPIGRLIQPIRQ